MANVYISSVVSDMVHINKYNPQKYQLLPNSQVLRTVRIVGYGLIQNAESEARELAQWLKALVLN